MTEIVRMKAYGLPSRPEEPSPALPSTKVLIAEDNPDLQSIFTHVFKWHKFEIAVANDGLEAVELLATFHPQLVVLDINMPRMNGFQVLKHIRSQDEFKDLKVIVVTGNCVATTYPEAALADLFLIKPIAIGDLMRFTKRLLLPQTPPTTG